MILDTLSNASLYLAAHPRFAKAFEFLQRPDLATLPCGNYEIDGKDVYASVQEPSLRPLSSAKVEFHRKYIDIQYVISGAETMGWSPLCAIGLPEPFDEAKDVGFAADKPQSLLDVRPGMFAVFIPTDAHAPLIGEGSNRKVVVKILA